jgi:hypothetical protein
MKEAYTHLEAGRVFRNLDQALCLHAAWLSPVMVPTVGLGIKATNGKTIAPGNLRQKTRRVKDVAFIQHRLDDLINQSGVHAGFEGEISVRVETEGELGAITTVAWSSFIFRRLC